MIPSTTHMPTWLHLTRCFTDSFSPRTSSMPRNTMWPPSSTGIGSMLRMARLTLKSAMKRRKVASPAAAASPEATAMVPMDPTSRGETLPVKRSRRKRRMRRVIATVSAQPVTTASPAPTLTVMVSGGSCTTPSRPRASAPSPIVSSSTMRTRAVPSLSSPSSMRWPGLAPISRTISAQFVTATPATSVILSPGSIAAPAAGVPGSTRPTTGSTQICSAPERARRSPGPSGTRIS